MRKPKPTSAQEEILLVLSHGGIIRADWITHRYSIHAFDGYVCSIPKSTMSVLIRNGWVAWNKDQKKRFGAMNDEYLITEEGREALR